MMATILRRGVLITSYFGYPFERVADARDRKQRLAMHSKSLDGDDDRRRTIQRLEITRQAEPLHLKYKVYAFVMPLSRGHGNLEVGHLYYYYSMRSGTSASGTLLIPLRAVLVV